VTAPTIARLDGVRPFVEVGVGSGQTDDGTWGQWEVDVWDDPAGAHWAGDQPLWLDVTCHVLDVATAAGRDRAVDKFEVGTATVTCENDDGWADFPLSIADLLDDDTLISIRPGRPIRIGVQVGGDAPVTLWAGYIDAVNPTYDPTDGERMTFECVDAKGDAGRTDLAKLAAPAGASETVTARVGRILNAATYPSYRRQLDGSGVALRGTTLGGKTVDLLDRAAVSAGGHVYGDVGGDRRDPAVTFRGRDWLDYPKTDPFDGTIGNTGWAGIPGHWLEAYFTEDPVDSGLFDPAPYAVDEDPDGSGLYRITDAGLTMIEDPPATWLFMVVVAGSWTPPVYGDTCPDSWELEFGRDDITTRALLGRQGEVEHVYNDAQGQALFGVETYTVRDLETDVDADIDWLGERILSARSWRHMPRVAAVSITAKHGHPETVDTLVKASPYGPARFAVKHYDGDRPVFDRVMLVVGVEHSITPDVWQARIALDDAAPFLLGGAQPALWDQVGVALWDAATWADPT
jgi:hypothetical protein